MSGPDNAEPADPRDEQRRLQDRLEAQTRELNLLRARFARYETVLRGSQVVVYTQDRELRYTSVSHPMLGRPVEDILGRTDAEILPRQSAEAIIAVKRVVLESGEAKSLEVAFADGPGTSWHDLHIEPLRDAAGAVVGLTCAAVDVTERKEGEAHLRLLLRELTHRSKNLLAVIQAMARQTAHHAGSIDAFLTQFSARLQALAASHDLLIRESWTGASLRELVEAQLARFMERNAGQIVLAGPDVGLKPEAAQNLGLALHELAANAAQFGALSVPDGKLSVSWRQQQGDDYALALEWREQAGPKVAPRSRQGFGSMVIERNMTRALEAKVELDFEPEGLRCRILIPAAHIAAVR